jgi:hypothetical protein
VLRDGDELGRQHDRHQPRVHDHLKHGGSDVARVAVRWLLTWVLACVCVGAPALAAGAALADGTNPAFPGSVLHVSIEGSLVAHAHVSVVATGTNAPKSEPILYGLKVFAIDHKQLVVPCSQSSVIEQTTVDDSPQAGVDLTPLPGIEGLSGPFTLSVPLTLGASGDPLICAYSLSSRNVLGGAADAASPSTEVTISATGAEPRSLRSHLASRAPGTGCAARAAAGRATRPRTRTRGE